MHILQSLMIVNCEVLLFLSYRKTFIDSFAFPRDCVINYIVSDSVNGPALSSVFISALSPWAVTQKTVSLIRADLMVSSLENATYRHPCGP